MWELFARECPFRDQSNEEARKIIIGGERPRALDEQKCPKEIWSIINDCWAQVPSDRLPVESIIFRLQKIQKESYPIKPDALYRSLLVMFIESLTIANILLFVLN